MPAKHYSLALLLATAIAFPQPLTRETAVQTKAVPNDTLGKVFFIYDGKACDCIQAQNAMMHQEIESVLHLPRFRSRWLWLELEYNQSRTEAELLLNHCHNTLMPIVGVLTQSGELVFEASGYLNSDLLTHTLDLLTPNLSKEAP